MSGILDQPIIIEMSARGAKGNTGDTGNGIVSITKTGTSGLIDTYTVLFTDNTTSTFEVANGNGIASIAKTSTSVLTDTYTVTFTNGTSTTFDVVNGNGIYSITKTGNTGLTDHYRIDFTNGTYTTYDVKNGKGIVSIAKTGTAGLVDTYTVTYNDSTTSTMTVTNGAKGDTGNGISSIAKTSTAGLVDTYTVTMTNGTTTTFTVTNGAKGDTGNGIQSIYKTGTVGAVDEYTILFTDATTTTFEVTNGSDEWGAIVGNLEDQTDLQDALDKKAVAITETASGSIVTIDDGADQNVEALTVNIDPVQDLNGYDNPWPAGGGKNLLRTTVASGTSNSLTYTVNSDGSIKLSGAPSALVEITIGTVNLTSGVTYKFNGCSYSTSSCRLQLKYNGTTLKQAYNNQDQKYTPNETGEHTVTFVVTSGTQPNITLYPMIRLSSNTDASWTPYSNLCPISGHTSAVVTRTGVNLFDKSTEIEHAQYRSTGMYENIATRIMTDYIPIKPNVTYTMSIDTDDSEDFAFINYNYFDASKTWIGDRTANNDSSFNGLKTKTFTITNSNARYLRIVVRSYANSNLDISGRDLQDAKLMLNLGSSASSYSAYSGTSVTIDLNGTRYGGTLDVVNGTLTVTHALVDLGSFTWTRNQCSLDTSIYRYQAWLTDRSAVGSSQAIGISSIFTVKTANILYGGGSGTADNTFATSAGAIYCRCDTYTDATNFKTAMSGQTVVYPLETPLTVTLDPHTLSLLQSENVVWASTGNVSVTYRADTKTYIADTVTEQQGLIGSVEVGTASRNFSVNEFLVMNNVLYKVIANIGSGSAITVGTNVVATTIAEQLTALLNA